MTFRNRIQKGYRRKLLGEVKVLYAKNTAVPKKNRELKNLADSFKPQNPRRWANIVDMGDIYAKGFYPYLVPDDKTAMACYETACESPDPVVEGNARAKMADLIQNPVSIEDRSGNAMDSSYGILIVKKAREELDARPELPPNDVATELEIRNSRKRRELNRSVPRVRAANRVGGGNQNTHDHGVTSATKSNIASMLEDFGNAGTSFRNDDAVVDEIVSVCRQKCEDLLPSVHEVVVSLSPDEYSGTGVSQIQILDLVLWKIKTITNSDVRNSVLETLCKRLASGFENGIVVCGTGKVSRMVSVFEGVLDTAQKGISINLVEREIAQLAAKVRDDFLESVGPLGREAYEGENSVPEYSKKMSGILREKVFDEYVTKLNMSASIISPLVETYSGAF